MARRPTIGAQFEKEVGMDWSREEVEAIVADYLHMLTLELAGQSYSKTAHRRALQSKLNGRSDGSIEFKHGNISAAMLALGFPYIRGISRGRIFKRSCLPYSKCK